MQSFLVPSVGSNAVMSGCVVQLAGKTIFEDALPLNAAVVVGNLIVCGGDNKKVVGIHVDVSGSSKIVFSAENSRKISKIARLNAGEVVVADSSGAIMSVSLANGQTRELFAHFSPVTALLVLGETVIVSADIDSQVRVCNVAHPREITHFLLGNSSPVLALYRGEHDQQVVCVTRDKVAKYFDLSSNSNLEMDPFANAGKPIQSTKSRKTKKAKKEDQE